MITYSKIYNLDEFYDVDMNLKLIPFDYLHSVWKTQPKFHPLWPQGRRKLACMVGGFWGEPYFWDYGFHGFTPKQHLILPYTACFWVGLTLQEINFNHEKKKYLKNWKKA